MKNIIVILILIFGSLNSNAQYDVSMGAVFNPNSIRVGNTTILEVSFGNLSPTGLAIPANNLLIQFYWGAGYSGSAQPYGPVASYFTWTNDNNQGWIGTNNIAIPFALNDNIFFEVNGTTINGPGTFTSFNAFILVGDDIYDNHVGSTPLIVAAPLPVKLVSFAGRSIVCNQVDLSWETASEYNSDHFVVERSVDGRQFQAIGKVKSLNKAAGASYKYIDQELYGGTRYFYRLMQVDFDGKTELFDPITTKTGYCSGTDVAMSVYPNPATDKAYIALEGFNQQDNIALEITNALGEVVMMIENAKTTAPNELKLSSIPAGVYNVKVIGFDRIASKMLIKID